MPQQIQWTLDSAPDPEEPPFSPAPPVSSRPENRHVWWLTVMLVGVVLAGLGAYYVWNGQKVSRDLRQLIASEETAGRAGDAAALVGIADPSDPAWGAILLQLAHAHQAAPLPSAVLQPVPGAADTIVLTTLAPNEVRADVTRSYQAPDGTTLAFTLPQFYRFTQKQWHHIAPPSAGATAEFWRGHYVSIANSEADVNYVANDLGPYLDDVVQRACDFWTCPRGPFIGVAFGADFSFVSLPSPMTAPAEAPLLFAFTRGANPLQRPLNPNLLSTAVRVPSPNLAGYPADAASSAWLRRAIAMQTLNVLADHIARPIPADHDANAFMLALVVRMGARLGLEPASVLDAPAAGAVQSSAASALASNVNLMWDMGLQDHHGEGVLGYRDADGTQFGPDDPGAWDALLSGALNMTNWMLRDEPPEADGNLLRQLGSADNQVDWLSGGLGIGVDEAWARLQLAAWQVNQPANQPEVLLTCAAGVALASPGQPQPIYFFPGNKNYFGSQPILSPKGDWVALDGGSTPLAIGLDTGTFVQAPPVADGTSRAWRGWLTDTVAAYLTLTPKPAPQWSVSFVDVANPLRKLPSLPGLEEYRPSPDGNWAAVIAPDPQLLGQLAVQVIPALGGPPKTIGDAASPDLAYSLLAWSPDSRLLAYAYQDPAGGKFSLRVMDLTSGVSHEILNSLDVGLYGPVDGLVAWSPSGKQMAFALREADPASGTPSAFGMTNVDGSGLTLLRQQDGFYTQVNWSADGQYLAATTYASQYQSTDTGTIEIFNTANSLEANELANSSSFAWSPQGHQLVDLHSPVELFSNPNIRAPQILSTDACSTATWLPQP